MGFSDPLQRALEECKYEKMTLIQHKALPALLEGRGTEARSLDLRTTNSISDLLGAAKTGSGKTLAFLIPAIELLRKCEFKPRNGTGNC